MAYRGTQYKRDRREIYRMPADKTMPMSFRFTPAFKMLLEAAAERENRSLTNTLETLLFAYCRQHGIELEAAAAKRQGEKVE
jgi:hypothetical protein